jgi:uncharacterized membrane protein (UPF0127 family)
MTALRLAGIALAWLLLTGQTGDGGFDDTLDDAFGKDTLIISADRHACWFFDIYVASNRAQQMRGLMHVRELPDFTGMIFIYSQAGIRSMWMKNTYISLDMLFIRGDGTVASVIANTTPLSLESQRSTEPVNFVLELNAGMAERLHIGGQSRIVFTNLD